MRTADPRERALVAEERMELTALAAQDLAQRGVVDVERVGPEMRQLGVEAVGGHEPTPARFFLPPSVRSSSPPSAKRTWNIGLAGAFFPTGT